jgi:hypothetical protein
MEDYEKKHAEKPRIHIPDLNKLHIKPFNPAKNLKNDRIVFLIGRRGSGKSVLEKDLLYYMRDKIDFGIALTKTLGSEDMFKACMPHEAVKREYIEQQIQQLIEHQLAHAHEVGREGIRAVYILFDDMTFDKSIFKGTTIRDVFMNGRHYNFFFVNSMQYCMDITVDMRSQIDYVFAMWEPNAKNRRRLWENFFGIFEDYHQFEIVFKAMTGHYGALVIDNTANSTKIEDSIFWYKAKPEYYANGYRIGCDAFWALSRKYYVSNEEKARDVQNGGQYSNQVVAKKRKLHETDVVRADEHGREFEEHKKSK